MNSNSLGVTNHSTHGNTIQNNANNTIKNKLLEFNRDITGLSSPPVLGFLCVLTFGLSPSFFMLLPLFIFNEIICSLIKYFYFKPRPIPELYENWYEKIQAASFPSIHAARLGVFTSFFFNYFHGALVHFKLKFILVSLFFLLVCYSRVILKKHHFLDVLAGGILGLLIGYFSGIVLAPFYQFFNIFIS